MEKKQKSLVRVTVAFAGLAVVVFAASALGVGFALSVAGSDWVADSGSELPIVLQADTASSGKSLAMATGLIDTEDNVEGLFVLDRLSGNLQCWVMNSQTGGIAAIYTAQPAIDMGLEKGGEVDYVMTTGRMNFQRMGRAGNMIPAGCVCYVGDGNSGNVVGYSVRFNRQAALRGGGQGGQMTLVCKGFARDTAMQRDQ
ncbi:MAG: hypothetical protein VYE64_04170 [Planctomycetota bacterium]|nr:hypothetical protein [Planctomycetota bacterium]